MCGLDGQVDATAAGSVDRAGRCDRGVPGSIPPTSKIGSDRRAAVPGVNGTFNRAVKPLAMEMGP